MRQFLFILAILSLLAACTMGYASHDGAPGQSTLSDVLLPPCETGQSLLIGRNMRLDFPSSGCPGETDF
jgi:hypothetical protein